MAALVVAVVEIAPVEALAVDDLAVASVVHADKSNRKGFGHSEAFFLTGYYRPQPLKGGELLRTLLFLFSCFLLFRVLEVSDASFDEDVVPLDELLDMGILDAVAVPLRQHLAKAG